MTRHQPAKRGPEAIGDYLQSTIDSGAEATIAFDYEEVTVDDHVLVQETNMRVAGLGDVKRSIERQEGIGRLGVVRRPVRARPGQSAWPVVRWSTAKAKPG